MKTNILVALSTATLLFSCNDSISEPPPTVEELSRTPITTIVPDTSSIVTEAKAMQIALTQLAPQGSRAAETEIKSVESLTDSLGIAQMYIVNFANNRGFVIVSASKDYLPVIAESDHGNFDINNISPDHPVNIWIAEQKFKISHADSFDPEVKASIASLWTSLDTDKKELISDSRSGAPDKPQVYYDSLARWSMDSNLTVYLYEDYMRTSEYANLSPMIKSEIQSQLLQWGNANYGSIESSTIVLRREISQYTRTQLLTTKWHQDIPFNMYVPNAWPLGCSTIAVGQIMYFHKYPSSFNWNEIQDNGFCDATERFLYHLGDNMGAVFSPNGTPCDNLDAKAYLERNGYKVTYQNYDTEGVLKEVSKRFPVFICGQDYTANKAHAWVCDGYERGQNGYEIRVMTIDYRPEASIIPDLMIEAYKKYTQTSYTPLRFHYNWGAKGLYDAYFDDTNIKINLDNGESRNYKDHRVTLYIRPL
ncbi:C10 family peptidase [Paramuribaculum intestinale]|uniref:C10 family peptidase n=1 Tax=Paramuribaculum intestinale TaxID=2094151 RepID=UPI000F49012E|nr:C10 family peptidase [Paramuribaculum intestinale]ROS93169.1 hypothetical protein EEL36_05445 [Muribaculaceae bacterium Isolate-043 (Harlan)]